MSYSSALLAYFFANKFNNIIPPITRSSKWPLFFRFSYQTQCIRFPFHYSCHIHHPFYQHWRKHLYSCKFLGVPSNAADVSVLLGSGDSLLDDWCLSLRACWSHVYLLKIVSFFKYAYSLRYETTVLSPNCRHRSPSKKEQHLKLWRPQVYNYHKLF